MGTYFTKKEQIVILIIVFSIVAILGMKIIMGDLIKPNENTAELLNYIEEDDEMDLDYENSENKDIIMVHISGQVYNPGIIELKLGKRVIELEPDLVINYGPGNEEENLRLQEAGIQVLGYLPESIDEVIETIKSIGKATGVEDKAQTVTENMLEKKDEILEKIKDTEKVKVFYEIWHDPLQAAGAGSFMDNLINLANGDNIAKDAEGEYPQYDLEQLVERDPEVYLTSADMPDKTVESISQRPGYSDITAIKEGNVYILDANITSRPGPRIIEALEIVAKAIHPEVFK
jgi:iron complex transport system substrate-binding protein